MDIRIRVPAGTNVAEMHSAFPDMYQDAEDIDGEDQYFLCVGRDEDDHDDDTRAEAEECCGAIETLCADADCLIDGCGSWAQGEIRTGDNYKRGATRANK